VRCWRLLFLLVRQIHYSAWLLAGLSSLLQILIFPLPGLYILSWLAFAPLIVALLRARPAGALEIAGSTNLQAATPGQAFLLAYVSGILWYAGTCYWIYDTMHAYGGLSAPMALLALFLFVIVRGFADTEAFDLSLPLWAIVLFSPMLAQGSPFQRKLNQGEILSSGGA